MKKPLNTDDIKKIALDILIDIDKFCKAEKIQYYLAYGTLLGAARHKGFIPWDDDIDIWMKREDYDRFREKYNFSNELYKFVDKNNTPGYYMVQGKVIDTRTELYENVTNPIPLGIFVDIFVMDNVPIKKEKILRRLRILRNILLLKNTKINRHTILRRNGKKYDYVIYSFAQTVLKCFKTGRIIDKMDKLASNTKSRGTEIGCINAMTYGTKEIFPCEFFVNTIDVEFENHMFSAPKEKEDILNRLYGDYMSLPKEEDRKTTHNYEAFLKGGYNIANITDKL